MHNADISKTENYTTEQLEKTFKEHSEKAIVQRQEQLEKFVSNNPDTEIPPHFLNNFCISKALHMICKEINQLKNSQENFFNDN